MEILYFILGLFVGLYLNSLFSNFIHRIAMKLLSTNPELIDKFKDKFNERIEPEVKQAASKFHERFKEMTPND